MTNLDFPAKAAEMGFQGVEFVNTFFYDKAQDTNYLTELKNRCAEAGVQPLIIMCDAEGELGNADEAERQQAVQNHHKWVDAAKFLGCHAIRVNAQSSGTYRRAASSAPPTALANWLTTVPNKASTSSWRTTAACRATASGWPE